MFITGFPLLSQLVMVSARNNCHSDLICDACSNIPSVLKSNCTVTLIFNLEGQVHILFPITDYVGVHI